MLSAFRLDRNDPLTRLCLNNPYEMHRTMMSGFPDVPRTDARRAEGVLYRLQPDDREIRLYVLSYSLPNWSRLPSGFVAVGVPKDLTEMEAGFVSGRRYAFDLLANPCKKVARDGRNSNRVFLATEEERAAWLSRKASAMGCQIRWMREEGETRSVAYAKNENTVEQTGVRFRGELTVTEPELFRAAFCAGIGPGKAFGFGMLMLFPARG